MLDRSSAAFSWREASHQQEVGEERAGAAGTSQQENTVCFCLQGKSFVPGVPTDVSLRHRVVPLAWGSLRNLLRPM